MTPRRETADVDAGERGARGAGWLTRGERGTVALIRFTAALASALGRRGMRPVVLAIALYYTLFDRTVREASREWLTLVHERPARLRDVFHHVATFAQVTLDRLFFAKGELDRFTVERNGNEHLEALAQEKRGAILLGAHLGSFEAMRASSRSERFPVTIVGHFENARMISALLEELDPDSASRVLHAGRDGVTLALELRDAIARGDFVALLADRVGLNDKDVRVPFFGRPARFATGPFLLASVLGAPIYLVFGLYRAPDRYELHCEPFVEDARLPRADRAAALEALVSRYASRLEAYARQAPDNWFNFYDFWEDGDA